MKQWSAQERGGFGVNDEGRIKCRDVATYRRLRSFGFSSKFMIDHWYVPDRDRRAPHELIKYKACKTCGVERRNDFKAFPKEPYGDRKLGRHTTGEVCRICVSAATQRSALERSEAGRLAKASYGEHGHEMWEPKNGS